MGLTVHLDESGDHGLQAISPDFPVFALTLCITDDELYACHIVPAFNAFKTQLFGSSDIILHSRKIRKKLGAFSILTDPEIERQCIAGINMLMDQSAYRLICVAIKKPVHKGQYGDRAFNPYHLSLKFALERLLPLVEETGQRGIPVIAEARGRREDEELARIFRSIAAGGTEYISGDRFEKAQLQLSFQPKLKNIIGHQICDLAGYPIARHVIDPTKTNPAYEIVRRKFYRGPGWVYGLKVFP